MKTELEIGDRILNTNNFYKHKLEVIRVTKTKAVCKYIGSDIQSTVELRRSINSDGYIKKYSSIKWDSNMFKLII